MLFFCFNSTKMLETPLNKGFFGKIYLHLTSTNHPLNLRLSSTFLLSCPYLTPLC